MRWGGLVNGEPTVVDLDQTPGRVTRFDWVPDPRYCSICGAEIIPLRYKIVRRESTDA